MSYTDIYETGTSRALPLRDSWGRPHTDSWWTQRQQHETATRPGRGTTVATRPEGFALLITA